MVNAKTELIEHIENREVEFVSVALRVNYDDPVVRIAGTLDEVLPRMDFEYDNGYGGQELFGYVWYADGSWSDRSEYDGSEWWRHQVRPDRNAEVSTW